MSWKMRRSPKLLLATGVAAAMLLSGCGGGTKAGEVESTDGKGEVKGNISVAWWGGDSRNAKTNAVIDMFEKKTPGVTTERQSADFAKYFDRLNVQASSKSLPCAVQMQGRQINDYTKRGVLRPLDEMIAAGTIDVSNIPPDVLKAGQGTDGKTYFVPYGAAYDSVTFNKTLAEKAGVGIPDADYTWDEFVAYLKKAQEGLPEGKYAVGNGGGGTGAINAWTLANGIPMFAEDGKLGFTKEDLTKFWSMWKDLQDAGVTVPAAKAAEQPAGADQGYLATGDVMVDFIPGNALFVAQTTLTGRKGGELTNLNYPVGSAGSGNAIFASGFGISSNCENVPTTAAFINYFTNDPEAGKTFASDNGAATNSKVLEEQLNDPNLPPLKKRELELYQEILKNDPPVIAFPPGFNAAFQQSFLRNYGEVSFGRMPVEDAVDAFFTETNATLG